MDLETLVVAVFCIADDFVCDLGRVRRRGLAPVLVDSEVLTVEMMGEFLGLDTHQGLHAYFGHPSPALPTVRRTTFLRQAANLWAVKQALWQRLAASTRQDAAIVLLDSLPVPVCRFARAHRCRSFAGLAAFGYEPPAPAPRRVAPGRALAPQAPQPHHGRPALPTRRPHAARLRVTP